MFIVSSYTLAVLFCFVTMICWGSWGNTQKLAGKSWRYELYYWDYTIGILLFALLLVFSLGSFGSQGRSFLEDIRQVSTENMVSAFVGGVIFNASNILLSASVSMAGMAVAFRWVLGWHWSWEFLSITLVLRKVIRYGYLWGFFLWWLPLSVMEWLQVRSRIVVLLGAGKGLF